MKFYLCNSFELGKGLALEVDPEIGFLLDGLAGSLGSLRLAPCSGYAMSGPRR